METITISKIEYAKLKRYSSAYLKIVEEITDAERKYPYDYSRIARLIKMARAAHKRGRTIEARSIDEAIARFSRQK
jgi:predicted nucleic acid-binding protein